MSAFDSVRFISGRPLLQEVSARKLNEVLAEIRRNKPKGERGITVRQSGDGTYIGLAAPVGAKGGTTAEPYPFKVVPSPWDDPDNDPPADQWKKFKVLPGAVNNLLATNYGAEFTAVDQHQLVIKATLAEGAGYVLSTELDVVAIEEPETALINTALGYELDGNGVPTRADLALALFEVDEEAEKVTVSPLVRTSLQLFTVVSASNCNSQTRNTVWNRL